MTAKAGHKAEHRKKTEAFVRKALTHLKHPADDKTVRAVSRKVSAAVPMRTPAKAAKKGG